MGLDEKRKVLLQATALLAKSKKMRSDKTQATTTVIFFGKFMALLLLFSCPTACRLDETPLYNDSLVEIPETFSISFHEAIDSFPRKLVFAFKTLEEYPCQNTSILIEDYFQNGARNINLKEVTEPEDCLVGYAPAKAQLDLGFLIQGQHKLNFIIKSLIQNTGYLEVSPERYTLNMRSEDGLVVERYELMRLPENAIWGYLLHEEQQTDLAEAFLLELDALSQPAHLPAGDYGFFSLNGEEVIFHRPEAWINDDRLMAFFLRSIDPSMENSLQELLHAYPALEVHLFTGWKGKL